MRTAKAQISLRIRAVWSGSSLSANRIIGYYRMYQRRESPRWDITHAQDAVNPHSLRMLITKTYLYNFDPLKPHFYIVKIGLQGYTLFSLFLIKNTDCGYPLEPHHWVDSNEYPQFMLWAEIWKLSEFFSENFHFLLVKFSIYLIKRVFVMWKARTIWECIRLP